MGENITAAEQEAKDKWDRIYQKAEAGTTPAPCEVLAEFQHLLPVSGSALDVACGLGGNSYYLAERQLQVTAIDISAVAVARIDQWQNPFVSTRCDSIDTSVLQEQKYDVIVVSRFLDRSICNALMDALQPQGLLFYQTFTREKVNTDQCSKGPSNPEFLLEPNELLSLFAGLKVLAYSDQGQVGNPDKGFRNQSWLVAQKV